MGWLLVMFDLPVTEIEERRQASRFRMDLLDEGFFMLQESVYARNCVTRERYNTLLNRVKRLSPDRGLVHAFYITNKQWGDSETLTLCRKKPKRAIDLGEAMPQQMTFW